MSNKGPILTDQLTSGAPAQFRPKGERVMIFASTENRRKNIAKAYASNRTKPRRRKK